VPLKPLTKDLRCTATLLDKSCGTEMVYHPRLALPHAQTAGHEMASHGLVASCQLDTNSQHIIGTRGFRKKMSPLSHYEKSQSNRNGVRAYSSVPYYHWRPLKTADYG